MIIQLPAKTAKVCLKNETFLKQPIISTTLFRMNKKLEKLKKRRRMTTNRCFQFHNIFYQKNHLEQVPNLRHFLCLAIVIVKFVSFVF